jgi:predicted TIM-barrel fold metal-dependent hydrolase
MTDSTDRRKFVKGTLATAMAVAGLRKEACSDEQRPPRVDTHLHCFAGTESQAFPYHPRSPYRPTEAATPEFLLQCMDAADVDFAIVVHPEPYQDDHRYLRYCLDVGRGRLKGTILLFSDRTGSLEKMPKLCSQDDIVAVRVHAYAPDRLPPFGTPQLRRLWTMAGECGIAVQLHFEPRYAPGFEPLIAEFPQTRVLIDHLGRPLQGTPQEHEVVVRWSRFPNTIMKLSSIPTNRAYPHREIQPIIRQLVDAYGPDRVMVGGGFSATATGDSYRAAFEAARSHLLHLSQADQDKILGGNAASIFQFV